VAAEQALARRRREEVEPRRVDGQPYVLADPRLRPSVDAGGEESAVALTRDQRAVVVAALVGDRVFHHDRLCVDLEEEEDVGAELLEHLDANVDLRQARGGELGVLERLGSDTDDRMAVACESRQALAIEGDRIPVLPQPEGPTRTMNSTSPIVRFTSSTATTSPFPNSFLT